MSDWKTVRLGEVCDTISATYKKGSKSVVLINTSDVLFGKVLNHKKEPNENLKGQFKKTFQRDDILYSEIRPQNKRFAFINFEPIDYIASTKLMVLRCKEYILPKYLFQILSSDEIIQNLQALAETRSGTFPQITFSELSTLEISLPSLEEQGRIAEILGALDDKIECNNRINRNLEEQASVLFRRWFVDFEFPDPDPTSPTYGKPYRSSGGEMQDSPLGLIPLGWQVSTLGDYCKVKSGFAFKSAWWQNNGIKVLKIKNIDSNNTLNLSDCSFVSEDNIILAKDFLVKGGDLLIAMTGATIGKFTIVPCVKEQLLVNQRVGKFFLGDNPIRKLPFLYLLLRQESIINEIINRGQGSAQPNISPSDIETIDIVLPNKQIIDIFNSTMQAIFSNLIRIIAENQTLATLRDTLLPKLMNNEITI